MKSGFKVTWTPHALAELEATIEYLETFFTEKEIKRLAQKIENTTALISQNPYIFQKSDKRGVFKVVLLKFNTIYYRIKDENVEIVSFFSNRQNLNKRQL